MSPKYYLMVTCNETYYNTILHYIQSNTVNTPYYFQFGKFIAMGVLEFYCESDNISDYSIYKYIKLLMDDLRTEVHYFDYKLTKDLLIPWNSSKL